MKLKMLLLVFFLLCVFELFSAFQKAGTLTSTIRNDMTMLTVFMVFAIIFLIWAAKKEKEKKGGDDDED